MDEMLLEEASQRIRAAQRIAVVSHVRPDGDAIGSLLGLGLALQTAGKEVQMVSADGVPSSFRHLYGSQQVRHRIDGSVDLAIVVDCSDLKRVGDVLNGYLPPDLNIDHHVTNLNFASYNLVNPKAAATAEILAEYLPIWGFELSQPVASALITGLITDTLGFRTSNVTPKVMRITADLMETGIDMPDLYLRALVQRSYEAIRFWGAGLSRLERDGPIVWATLTLEDRIAADYPGRDDADLINVLTSIKDAQVTIIFVEQLDDEVKVSWRAQTGIDVSRVALSFGGGGHPAAAGAEIAGDLEYVRKNVLQETQKLLDVRETK